jgi:hypothetical protein
VARWPVVGAAAECETRFRRGEEAVPGERSFPVVGVGEWISRIRALRQD